MPETVHNDRRDRLSHESYPVSQAATVVVPEMVIAKPGPFACRRAAAVRRGDDWWVWV